MAPGHWLVDVSADTGMDAGLRKWLLLDDAGA
jgi:hypothetical protein